MKKDEIGRTPTLVHRKKVKERPSPSEDWACNVLSSVFQEDLACDSIGHMLQALNSKVTADTSQVDLVEINTISGILQRLLSSSQQIVALHKIREDCKQDAGAANSDAQAGLDSVAIQNLERQLDLL
jgi:hypothetical protein